MTATVDPPGQPWSMEPARVLDGLDVEPDRGLDRSSVGQRRNRHGPNQLRQTKRRSAWRILLDQFASLIVGLLAAASIAAFLLVDWIEGTAIAAVIVINALLGFFTELKAVRSMEALYRLGQVTARVRRSGRVEEIPAAELVPGDVVLVEGGDVVTADLRLLEASKLQANEAALTGESAPVGKSVDAVPEEAVLAERASMLYKGTAVTRGSGVGVVVATGLDTELGRITSLVEETEGGETPLERRLDRLARRLVLVTLGLAVVVGVLGVIGGRDLALMLETAIALAVATVPEGLPVVATIALARGMWRMARQNALINRLSAVETLGATGVICTDKTGTLTENRMTVAQLRLPAGAFELRQEEGEAWFELDGERVDLDGQPQLRESLETGLLCNNAEPDANGDTDGERATGDPMEVALLVAAIRAGVDRAALLEDQPEEREEAFDPETKLMATFHRRGQALRVAVKGAPEAVVAACSRVRDGEDATELGQDGERAWLEHNDSMAKDGLRVLGLATREASDVDEDPYEGLVLLGLVGLVDPPREDVRDAIAHCRSAGIEVVMVTGDQAATAGYVAQAVGLAGDGEPEVLPGSAIKPVEELGEEERERLLQARLFARVEPAQKLNLIGLHQHAGNVVAMTGDGVNDAPALKKADIGIAMGQRGTQVAREAAAMVLKDDAFGTIVVAVRQGRIIFDNIRRFVLYLLSCNVSELLVVALASVASAPLPILPLQILFLNLVTDVFPALALGVGPGDPDIMQRRPRPAEESILARKHWIAMAAYGSVITVAVLGAFAAALLWLQVGEQAAVTVSFLTLALAQLWHVFNMRDAHAGLLGNDVVRNPWVWGALVLCVGLIAAGVFVPALADLLGVVPLEPRAWLLVAGCSILPLVAGQLALAVLGRRSRNRHAT